MSTNNRSRRLHACLLVALALPALYFALVPRLLGEANDADLSVFYASGQCLHEKASPYEPDQFAPRFRAVGGTKAEEGFHYPPTALPIVWLMSRLPYEVAGLVAAVFGLIGYYLLIALLYVRLRNDGASAHLAVVFAAAALCCMPAWRLAWTIQPTYLTVACLLAAWQFIEKDRVVIAGMLLALAAMKPTYAALPILWLLLTGRFHVVAVAALVSAVAALPAMIIIGSIEVWTQWMASLPDYHEAAYNRYGAIAVAGLGSVLTWFDIHVHEHVSGLVIQTFGVAFVLLLRCARRRLDDFDALAVLVEFQFAVIYGRYSELLLLAPMCARLLWYGRSQRAVWMLLAVGFIVVSAPNRLAHMLGDERFAHVKTVVALIWLSYFLTMLFKRTQPAREPADNTVENEITP